jgi:hypothetical protein
MSGTVRLALAAGEPGMASFQWPARRARPGAPQGHVPLLIRVHRQYALDVQRRFGEIDREWIARAAADSPEPAPWLAWLAMIDANTGQPASARATIVQLTHDNCAALPMRTNWLAACELADAAATVGDPAAATALHPGSRPMPT